jgi:hypothetical protein
MHLTISTVDHGPSLLVVDGGLSVPTEGSILILEACSHLTRRFQWENRLPWGNYCTSIGEERAWALPISVDFGETSHAATEKRH